MNKWIALFLLLSGVIAGGNCTALGAEAKATETAKKAGPLPLTLSDKAGGAAVTSFPSTQPEIFLTYPLDTLSKGDKIKAVWTIEDGPKGVKKNAKVSEFTNVAEGSKGKSFFHLTKPGTGWPVGQWRVDAFVNEVKSSSVKFTIK